MSDIVTVAFECVGKRWFYCVTLNHSTEPEKVLAYGYKDTFEEAEEQIYAQAVIHRPDLPVEVTGDWMTKELRRRLWQEDNVTSEVVWVHGDYGDSDYRSSDHPCPIIKKTANRIYVQDNRHGNVRTIILDRSTLESEGCAWSQSQRETYHTQPSFVQRIETVEQEFVILDRALSHAGQKAPEEVLRDIEVLDWQQLLVKYC